MVASIVAGDPAGLAAAYDRYAAQLYAYCRSMLREPADAADAVQDTFVIAASRLKDLREPDQLRAWLYTVARNASLRKIKAEKKAAVIYSAAPAAEETTEVGDRAELAELRALVHDSSGGLTARDREILTLRLWQGMDPAESAMVLGVSRGYASALFARARAQLEVCIGVLLVARTGRDDCRRLASLLDGWDGQLTVLLRKRLSRHVDHCPNCSDRRRRELVPALLGLSVGAAVTGAAAADAVRQAAHLPVALKGNVLTAANIPAPQAAAAGHAAAGQTAGEAAHAGPAGTGAGNAGSQAGSFGKGESGKAAEGGLHLPHPSRGHVTAAAGGVAAAAVIATAAALVLSSGPHHSALTGGGPEAAAGLNTPSASGGQTAGPTGQGPTGPGAVPGSRGATSPAAEVSALPHSGVLGGGSPQPTAGSSAAPTSGSSGGGSTSGTSSSAPPSSAPPSSAPPSSAPPAAGTLTVTPTSVQLLDLGSTAAIKLTAQGGPVNWSISASSTLLGAVTLSAMHGSLASGQSTTVTIKVATLLSLATTLKVSPGNIPVTVVLGLGL